MWNNRIFRHKTKNGVMYAIHETFYDDDGKVDGWTEEPETGMHESVEDLIASLKYLYKDAKRFRKDVLDFDNPPAK